MLVTPITLIWIFIYMHKYMIYFFTADVQVTEMYSYYYYIHTDFCDSIYHIYMRDQGKKSSLVVILVYLKYIQEINNITRAAFIHT